MLPHLLINYLFN